MLLYHSNYIILLLDLYLTLTLTPIVSSFVEKNHPPAITNRQPIFKVIGLYIECLIVSAIFQYNLKGTFFRYQKMCFHYTRKCQKKKVSILFTLLSKP